MSDFNLRLSTYKDAEALYLLFKNTGYIRFYGDGSREEVVPKIIKNLYSPEMKTVAVVCEIPCNEGEECFDNKRIISYSIIGPYDMYKNKNFPVEKENFAYSLGTGVHSDFRKQGLGEALRAFIDDLARKKGYRGVYTDVATNNAASLRVQEKSGFTQVAIVEDPKRPIGIGSVIFRKAF